jgi:hypothetical protein
MASRKGQCLSPRAEKLRYLDRTAEEAGREKRKKPIPSRLTPKKTIAQNVSLDDIENFDLGQDFGNYYTIKYLKAFSGRAQLDKLAAIYGLLKAFEGKTFDEFYSAFKTGCSQNSLAALHVAQHAMEKLYTSTEIVDGVIFGTNKRRFGQNNHQLKKDDYYVNDEGIICRVLNDNSPSPKVYQMRKGFWSDVYIKVNKDTVSKTDKNELQFRYVIGPFYSDTVLDAELKAFNLENGFSNEIYWQPGCQKIKSNLPIPGHYPVRDWNGTYWCPRYYIVLDVAKVQSNPLNKYFKSKPTYSSVGTVIYDQDILYPI